jgi:hypothetical protein
VGATLRERPDVVYMYIIRCPAPDAWFRVNLIYTGLECDRVANHGCKFTGAIAERGLTRFLRIIFVIAAPDCELLIVIL